MISKLFQPDTPFELTPSCESGRTENIKRYLKHGKIYTMVWRDKIVVEDHYLVLLKGSAYSIRTGQPYFGSPLRRSYRDVLLKAYPTI